MKKLLALILVAAMCLSMSGCALVFNVAKEYLEETSSTEAPVDVTEESEAPVEDEPVVEDEPAAEDEAVNDLLDGLEFYTYPDGIHLMMEKGMEESEADGFTVYAYSNSAMFAAIKEDAAVFESAGLDIKDYDLYEYAEVVRQGNGLDEEFAEDIVGNLSVTYTSNQNGTDFFYYATVKEGTDCYWVVTFACFEEDKDTYLPQFQVWGASIVTD